MTINAQFPDKLRFLFKPHRYKVARGGRGSAKCFAFGTKVLMYDGTLKAVEDILVGDLVMGPDSKPRFVLSVTNGESNLYKVRQTSAIDYVVNEDHILSLKKSKSCARDVGISTAGNPRRPGGCYPGWPEVVNIGIKDYIWKSIRWKDNFRGYKAGLIEFKKQDVPVDPYLLGAWLGDGLHRELMITSADQEIVQWMSDYAIKNGAKLTCNNKSGKSNKAKDYRIVKKEGRKNPIWQGFKTLNVVSNKHIPQCYITNSEDVRLRLLAGLIDTDGTYSLHGYSITSANEGLAKDIKRLVDTLGFRTSITEKKTQCGKYKGKCWKISINGDVWKIPCCVERKKYSHNGIKPNKDKTLSYIKVEPIGVGKYAGFSVDGDHLFCLEDGTVVHNSWSFARALLIMGAARPLRILCAREVQMSIRQSVHKLLTDQIALLGMSTQYQVFDASIRGRNGTEFAFTGLSQLTVDTIKSFEGYDICWVEEGQVISKRSWDILIPTIRKDNSEIWICYNPDLETDETHRRFTITPPKDCVNVEINWRDNPWFNETLDQERIRCQETQPDDYDNIWEGKCRPAVEGAIYYKQIQEAETASRIRPVPYDPMLKVHIVMDLGWEDSLAIAMVQKVASEIRIIEYIEAHQTPLTAMSNELRLRGYNWGKLWLPHDGFASQLNSGGLSTADIMSAQGWDVVPKVAIVERSVEEGIRISRLKFHQIYFDADKTGANEPPQSAFDPKFNHTNLSWRLIEALKRYRRSFNRQTEAHGAPVHDAFAHAADCLRYIAVNADNFQNEEIKVNYDQGRARTPAGPQAWMAG